MRAYAGGHCGLRCQVVYATPARQYLWSVELPPGATIAAALAAARRSAALEGSAIEGLDWDRSPVGVFGELRTRDAPCADGDRIEIYRPLRADPRTRRRARAQQQRVSGSKKAPG